MAEIKEIHSHNQILEGDYIITETIGEEIRNILVPQENGLTSALGTLKWLVSNCIVTAGVPCRFLLCEYISPLRQRRIREVKLT